MNFVSAMFDRLDLFDPQGLATVDPEAIFAGSAGHPANAYSEHVMADLDFLEEHRRRLCLLL